MKIDENIILNRLSTIRAIAKWKLPQIMKSMKEEQQKQDELTSQSAKPEQATNPASPCPADVHTPPNSRQSGANDGEVLENMICPSANQCDDMRCPSRKPHVENELCKNTCLLEPGSRYVGQCIQIPETWFDKGLHTHETKQEKAEAVRKYVLRDMYRDIKTKSED